MVKKDQVGFTKAAISIVFDNSNTNRIRIGYEDSVGSSSLTGIFASKNLNLYDSKISRFFKWITWNGCMVCDAGIPNPTLKHFLLDGK